MSDKGSAILIPRLQSLVGFSVLEDLGTRMAAILKKWKTEPQVAKAIDLWC